MFSVGIVKLVVMAMSVGPLAQTAPAPTPLQTLVTGLLGFMQVFFDFALDLLVPKLVNGAYDISLINIVVWVPILFGLIGVAVGFFRKYLLRSKS